MAAIVSLAASWLALQWMLRARLAKIHNEHQRTLGDVRGQAAKLIDEAKERARIKLETLDRRAAEELAAEEDDLKDYDRELTEREEVSTTRDRESGEWETLVKADEQAVAKERETLELLRLEFDDLVKRAQACLETQSGVTAAEAIEQVVNEAKEKAQLAAQILVREREDLTSKESAGLATRLLGTVLERYDGMGHLERIQNTVEIPDAKTVAALADTSSPASQAFRDETNCELVCDTELNTVTVRGDDPLGREIARRVVRQIANRPTTAVDRIRALGRQVKDEVEREVQNAGRKAARSLNLRDVHPEVLHLVGRLKFRLSYSQNQLKHAVEVATIAGMLAEELGLDVMLARRGGLLHDIGKAMTHDHEGSHAVLGATVARKCGEVEAVANAIGSHHNDEPMKSPAAFLVTAADALSGARPGARRESVTQYISRMEEIQEIASRARVVRRVDVMHAGREVRVIVAGEEQGAIDDSERQGGYVLADKDLQPLAQAIAKDLEQEVTFAGQIKVTVIRESRAVAIAV